LNRRHGARRPQACMPGNAASRPPGRSRRSRNACCVSRSYWAAASCVRDAHGCRRRWCAQSLGVVGHGGRFPGPVHHYWWKVRSHCARSEARLRDPRRQRMHSPVASNAQLGVRDVWASGTTCVHKGSQLHLKLAVWPDAALNGAEAVIAPANRGKRGQVTSGHRQVRLRVPSAGGDLTTNGKAMDRGCRVPTVA